MSAPPPRGSSLARQRLLSSDFTRIYKRGRRARGAHFAVVVLANELERTRLGLSVSKRHAKLAVDRNRLRRLLREAFRLERANLPPGLDVVLVSIVPGRPPPLAVLRAELVALVLRAHSKPPRAPAEPPR